MAHKEIKYPKKREALLRYHHGENWTDEDQEKFERERNRKQCLNHRNRHREAYTDYQRCYQQKFREEKPYYYGWKQYLRLHPDETITYEQYINYRKNKERQKEIKEQNDELR